MAVHSQRSAVRTAANPRSCSYVCGIMLFTVEHMRMSRLSVKTKLDGLITLKGGATAGCTNVFPLSNKGSAARFISTARAIKLSSALH
jgi:hypothetical protein